MSAVNLILGNVAWLIAGLLPLYAFCHVTYLLVSLPLRRQERARLFLDLIETGLAQGRSIEHTVVSISQSGDRSVGVRFHLLAAYLESGWNLITALEKTGGLLTPQAIAMLRVGEEIGDVRRVLPACRTLLKDALSQIQSAYNYLVVLAFVLVPVIPALFWIMAVFVVPKYEAIFADMLEGQPLRFMPFQAATVLSQVQLVLALLFYLGAVFYIGGPRLLGWLQAGFALPSFDWIFWHIPWRRKRIQRDFAAMLGVLLDSGVPEARAVALAAQGTGNKSFVHKAEAAVVELSAGAKLVDAVALLDHSGEFRWRLRNATQAGSNFFAALRGWLEVLDARAFQQQQAFAQLLTTLLVLYNGAMVSLFTVFVFGGITQLIQEGVLW